MNVREYIRDHVLLFDGAMGTFYAARNGRQAAACEQANVVSPDEILEIHREYLRAGACALKSNTFGVSRVSFPESECRKLLQAGWKVAQEAAAEKPGTFVFADIGPIQAMESDRPDGSGRRTAGEYRFLADEFLALGAENFLFETNCDDDGILETAAYIHDRQPDSFIMVSFASLPDGFTRSGRMAATLLRKAAACPAVDAVGLNCVTGARHMAELAESLYGIEKPLSFMPNAGYPTVIGNRTVYEGAPDYFAQQLRSLVSRGARILGGCCGTTPEHIAAVNRALQAPEAKVLPVMAKQEPQIKTETKQPTQDSAFWKALCDPEQKPFAVELDPPESADVTKFIHGVQELKDSGAAVITIADCPIARARMDSSLLACRIRRELDMEALPHMTCRDRNLNATKALLLGLCAENVHNVLVVTGDPIPSTSRDEVKSVYNFNSRMLASFITSLGESMLPVPFHVFGALNVNARNFRIQLELAKQKVENGICGFLTQPVLTEQGFENLKLAREELDAKLLGGIIPVISQRNALFMNSEVAGISVDEKVTAMYEGADRARGEELALNISAEIARRIAPYVDGYYLITPFGRTALMSRIMQKIRQEESL